jgi:hypothetical protein
MATRRKTPIDRAPGELEVFDATEWASPTESSWWPAYQRWRQARRLWVNEHPDGGSLGDQLDRMRHEHQARMEMEKAFPEPGLDHSISGRPPQNRTPGPGGAAG